MRLPRGGVGAALRGGAVGGGAPARAPAPAAAAFHPGGGAAGR